jgi:hypothetical protein
MRVIELSCWPVAARKLDYAKPRLWKELDRHLLGSRLMDPSNALNLNDQNFSRKRMIGTNCFPLILRPSAKNRRRRPGRNCHRRLLGRNYLRLRRRLALHRRLALRRHHLDRRGPLHQAWLRPQWLSRLLKFSL